MATPKKNDTKKPPPSPKGIMDVSKPGQTAASATSRPIIVGHKPQIKQDPMVSPPKEKDEAVESKEDSAQLKTVGREKTIVPIGEAPAAETELATEEKTEETESADPETTENTPAPSSAAAVDVLANEVNTKQTDNKLSDEETKREAEIESLIQSRKYFVPIGEVSKRRTHLVVLGVLIGLIVILISLNLAIDAELLEVGLEPLTDVL